RHHPLSRIAHRSLQQPVGDSGNAQWSGSDVPGHLGISIRRTGGARYVPSFSCAQISSTRFSISLANCLVLCPSTPLAASRFIIRQVSLRNSGVSERANEVNRTSVQFGFLRYPTQFR
ncbi:hypothetical protein, partial [Bradyrhizobium elkanii]|uniref:hypothetical protein n=1 Tax=Bradyrhizobium elkanii TaxID=29448 RepID=UPI001AEC7092